MMRKNPMQTTRIPQETTKNTERGFSLVELSIVLVILGLLVGGVMTGQNLIRAAELRNVGKEYQHYVTAMYTFRDKYAALPGDMRNATQFWGIAAGTTGDDATCKDTASTDGTTCNGDGDGRIGVYTSMWNTSTNEVFRAMQHLANAGLIEGSFNGLGTGNPAVEIGVNSPASKSGGQACWNFWNFVNYNVNHYFDNDFNNVMEVGSPMTDIGCIGGTFTPEEAWNIDTKLDDGLPGQGFVHARESTNCGTTNDALTAEYALSSSARECSFVFAIR